jgi:hypothetical protein
MRALYCMLYQKCIKCIGSKRKKKKKKKNLKPSQDLNWKDIKFMIDRNDYWR